MKNMQGGNDYNLIRDQLIDEILENASNAKTFLDLACGTGDFMRKMEARGFETTAIEFSAEAIKIAKEKKTIGEIILQDLNEIEDLNLDKKFDIISCKLVLAFTKNRVNLLKWVKEHLSETGIFVLNSPIVSKNKPFGKPGIEIKESELENLLKLVFKEVKLIDENKTEIGFLHTYICK